MLWDFKDSESTLKRLVPPDLLFCGYKFHKSNPNNSQNPAMYASHYTRRDHLNFHDFLKRLNDLDSSSELCIWCNFLLNEIDGILDVYYLIFDGIFLYFILYRCDLDKRDNLLVRLTSLYRLIIIEETLVANFVFWIKLPRWVFEISIRSSFEGDLRNKYNIQINNCNIHKYCRVIIW